MNKLAWSHNQVALGLAVLKSCHSRHVSGWRLPWQPHLLQHGPPQEVMGSHMNNNHLGHCSNTNRFPCHHCCSCAESAHQALSVIVATAPALASPFVTAGSNSSADAAINWSFVCCNSVCSNCNWPPRDQRGRILNWTAFWRGLVLPGWLLVPSRPNPRIKNYRRRGKKFAGGSIHKMAS